jgi:MFS family permease
MQRVAQDWLVLELTHGSGTALGLTTGLQFLPTLLSMWGGMVADRYSKRRVLMATQAAMGGLALILGVLAITHSVQIWQVYTLAFALGMVTVVDNPTRQASPPRWWAATASRTRSRSTARCSTSPGSSALRWPGWSLPRSGRRSRSWSTRRPTVPC